MPSKSRWTISSGKAFVKSTHDQSNRALSVNDSNKNSAMKFALCKLIRLLNQFITVVPAKSLPNKATTDDDFPHPLSYKEKHLLETQYATFPGPNYGCLRGYVAIQN